VKKREKCSYHLSNDQLPHKNIEPHVYLDVVTWCQTKKKAGNLVPQENPFGGILLRPSNVNILSGP
jgi:hypothetical protein